MSDPRPDPRDPPTICPDCGGDVVRTDADGGYVCEDCGRDLFILDSRGDDDG
jgi:DNA-directed RNA polymerase subunit RPC12/RpoP